MAPVPAAAAEAIVRDVRNRRHVAVHPGYACASAETYRRALAARVAVCVLAFVSLVFNVVGQVVPYYSLTESTFQPLYYSLWQRWWGGPASVKYRESETQLQGLMAVIGSGFLVISVILSAVLASAWSKHERERLEDRAGSELAMAEFGHPRQAYGDRDDAAADDFPYTNLRVANHGLVQGVAYEKSELKRRRYDRDVCAATLSMLIFSTLFNLLALAIMSGDVNRLKSRRSTSTVIYTDGVYRTHAGIPLMAIAMVVSLAAFILVAIPQATKVRLCGKLRPQPCMLVVVDDAAAAEITAELGQYATGNLLALASVTPGVREALAGPADGAVAASTQGAAPAVLNGKGAGKPVQMTSTSAPYGYTSANYYPVAPQLFTVHECTREDVADVHVDCRRVDRSTGDGKQAESTAASASMDAREMSGK